MPYEKINNEIHCLSNLAPFEIPDTWEWCRVGDLFTNITGLSYKKDLLDIKSEKMIRVLRGGNIGDEKFYFKDDDVMISSEFVKQELLLKKNYMITPAVSSLEHIGKIALVDKDYLDTVVGGFVLMLIPLFNNDELSQYLLYTLDTKYHRDNCRKITHKSGQAFYNLSREHLMNLPIPLPPIGELKRINIQLKRILPLVSEYKAVYDNMNILNNSFIDSLKKSILQQAVMGKLVPQNPKDEPASVLLERIREEKQALIKAGKLKKDKNESIIYRRDNSHYEKCNGKEICIDAEIPFDIPNTWAWTRASSLGSMIRGKGIKRTETVQKGLPCVRYGEIYTSYYISFTDTLSYIDESLDETCLHFYSDDIIFTLTGENKVDIAKAVAYLGDKPVAAGGDLAYWTSHGLNPLYIVFYMACPYCIEQKRRVATGDIIVHISTDKVGNFLIPVPPLLEQRRIVNTILETFTIISAL